MNIEDFINENKDLNIKEYSLNNTSVVYFLCNFADEVVYIGKSLHVGNRIINHLNRFPIKSIFYVKPPKNQASKWEKEFIKKINPKYNIVFNDNNGKQPRPRTKSTMKMDTTKIKQELERLGKNQSWLANKMNVSRQLLFYMVKSKKITHAERIAKALNLDPRDLIK